jgi:hypothetical protein
VCETKFHTHTKQLADLQSRTAGGMTEDSEPNGSKHSTSLAFLAISGFILFLVSLPFLV